MPYVQHLYLHFHLDWDSFHLANTDSKKYQAFQHIYHEHHRYKRFNVEIIKHPGYICKIHHIFHYHNHYYYINLNDNSLAILDLRDTYYIDYNHQRIDYNPTHYHEYFDNKNFHYYKNSIHNHITINTSASQGESFQVEDYIKQYDLEHIVYEIDSDGDIIMKDS